MYEEYAFRWELITVVLNFFLILILGILNFSDIKKQFRKIRRKYWLLLFIIFLLGSSLRIFVSPYALLGYDELYSIEGAKSILLEHQYTYCSFGYFGECYEFQLDPHTPNYPLLISISYILFGISNLSAMIVSLFFGNLSIISIFLVTYLLFKKESVGLYSAFMLGILPLHIKYSSSAAPEPTFMFFVLLSVLSFLLAYKINTKRIIYFAIVCLAYTLGMRPESLFLAPFLILGIYLFSIKKNKEFASYKLWLLLSVLLIFTFIIRIPLITSINPPTIEHNKLISFEVAEENLPVFASIWLSDQFHSLILIIFVLVGIMGIWKENKRMVCTLVLLFLIHSIIVIFYAIVIVRYRHLLVDYLPFIIFGGYGLYFLINLLEKKFNLTWAKKSVTCILVLLMITPFCFYLPLANSTNKFHGVFYPEEVFASFLKEKINNECYVIARLPHFINFFWNKKAIQVYDYYHYDERAKMLLNEGECVLFYDNGFCDSFGTMSKERQEFTQNINNPKICNRLLKNYNLDLIYEKESYFPDLNLSLYGVSLRNYRKVNEFKTNVVDLNENISKVKLGILESKFTDETYSDITLNNETITIIQSFEVPNQCYVISAKILKGGGEISIYFSPVKNLLCSPSCDYCPRILTTAISLDMYTGTYIVNVYHKNKLLNKKTITID